MDYASKPFNIGKISRVISAGGVYMSFRVEDEIIFPHSNVPKLIYFQKLRWMHDNSIEYRLAYYVRSTKPPGSSRWVFGRSPLMLPPAEFSSLLNEARARGWEGV